MILSFVVAMAQNRVIGLENGLPWHLPNDLKFFKRITMGKPMVMGRKTHESIGRPLPGRTNIIVTHSFDYSSQGCIVVHSIEEALAAVEAAEEVTIIGGASLYEQTLPQADRIYLTLVHGLPEGDAWFPEFNWGDWEEVWREDHPADERHVFPYSFIRLDRK